MNKKIRWGIISSAKIAREQVIPALQKSKECEIVAIASRSLATAKAAAKAHKIPKSYGSYEEMFADPDIDAVYNPLPNHLHVSVTLQAAKAGKHVLCEKPAALDVKEAKKLLALPKGIQYMEAFMVRFHPQWQEVKAQVEQKKLGDVQAVQAFFSYYNTDVKNIRNMSSIGGGGMYDIGCYPTVIGKYVFGTKPLRVLGLAEIDKKFKVDKLFSAIYDFGKGRHLTFSVSTQLCPMQRVLVMGTKARLEVQIPFNAPAGKITKLTFNDGSSLDESKSKIISIPACDQYQLECEAFNRAIRKEAKLAYSVADAIENAAILDAVFKSVKSGKWQEVIF